MFLRHHRQTTAMFILKNAGNNASVFYMLNFLSCIMMYLFAQLTFILYQIVSKKPAIMPGLLTCCEYLRGCVSDAFLLS